MITRIEIDGFKSLRDFSMDLEPFTVLVGPNSVGKSNVLDALMLLSRLASVPISEAFKSGRGLRLDQFTWRGGEPGRTMRFAAEMWVDIGSESVARAKLRYELALERRTRKSGTEYIAIQDERLFLSEHSLGPSLAGGSPPRQRFDNVVILHERNEPSKDRMAAEPRPSGSPLPYRAPSAHTALAWVALGTTKYIFAENAEEFEGQGLTPPPDQPLLETRAAADELWRMRLLRLDVSRLRAPSEALEAPELAPDASNLPAVLADLEPGKLGEIRADLVSLVPGLTSFRVVSSDDSLHIEFEFAGGERLPARVVSDGTLRLLALFTALRASPEPLLLGLEEPENGVYPGKLRALLSLLQEPPSGAGRMPEEEGLGAGPKAGARAPARTQIVLTTHSPVVLAAMRSKPECLRFLDLVRRDGQLVTRARRIAPSITPTQARDFVSLGEVDRLLNSLKAEVADVAEVAEAGE